MEEATREVAAAQYRWRPPRPSSAPRGRNSHLEERCSHYGVLWPTCAASGTIKRPSWSSSRRAAQTEQDTGNARRRIEALEGRPPPLGPRPRQGPGPEPIPGEGGEIGAEIAEFNMRLASLDAERMASEKALDELEGLRRDMAGDREERYQLIEDLKKRNGSCPLKFWRRRPPSRPSGRRTGRSAMRPSAASTRKSWIWRLSGTRPTRTAGTRTAELLSMEQEVSVLEQKKVTAALEEKQILDKLWETYELSTRQPGPSEWSWRGVPRPRGGLGSQTLHHGPGQHQSGRHRRVPAGQRAVYLPQGPAGRRAEVQAELENIIADITAEMKTIFPSSSPSSTRPSARPSRSSSAAARPPLELEDPEDILNCGIEIKGPASGQGAEDHHPALRRRKRRLWP